MKTHLSILLFSVLFQIHAQAQSITLRPGQSMQARSGEVFSCEGGRRGYEPPSRPLPPSRGTDRACMIHYENDAYHVYAVNPSGQTQVLSYDRNFNQAMKQLSYHMDVEGTCAANPIVGANCRIENVNNIHHVYMYYGAKRTTVGWSWSFGEATSIVETLRMHSLCH